MKEGKEKMANTSLAKVYNPARKITAGKPTAKNPVKKTSAVKKNPTKKVVSASSRRSKPRRKNPSSLMGLLGAALMVGLSVTIFDILTTRFLPSSSIWWRVGVKGGGAYLLQSSFGAKIPVLGKYKNEIALVLAVSAFVDLFKALVLPTLDGMTGGLLTGQTVQMVKAPADEELGADEYYYVEEVEDDYFDDDEEDYS